MKTIKLIILFSLTFKIGFCQEFKNSSKINTSPKAGLHKIELTPKHKQLMTTSFNDVRIYDSANIEIPYVILSEPVLKSKTDFIEYTILSQKYYDTYTEIIIENKNLNNISNIAFNINNSDALKYCSIEGSNDSKEWYSVSTTQLLSLSYNEYYTNQYKCIYFPLNNYAYFKLIIDNWYSNVINWKSEAPFKVNSAGYFKNSFIAGKLNPVSFNTEITNDIANKKTTIKFAFQNNQSINQIQFKISKPRLFLRQAKIYVLDKEVLKNKKLAYYKNTLYDFELNSEKQLTYDIPEINTKELFIEIENNDNQALQIDSIFCKQLASYIIFDCANDKSYFIKCGNSKLKKPIYDLISFVKESPQLLPEATLNEFKNIETIKNTVVIEKKFYETKLFIWICILVAAIAIGLFSWKLMKDMKEGRD